MSSRPIMIAVGGDCGTGKTKLCRGLDLISGCERIETICLDEHHSLNPAQRKAVNLIALDPRANNFVAMEEDLWALGDCRSIRPERLGEFKDEKGNTKFNYSLALAQLLIARRAVRIENELLEMVP